MMAPPSSNLFIFFMLLISITVRELVAAQTCYYPDGTPTDADAPCPNSDLCCPLNWQCLANGLCYDPTNDYYERRTCTDKSWGSSECPNFCTYSEGGNEAILLCNSGKYCCDGNRVSFDCCDGTLPHGTTYFNLQGGDDVVGSITSLGPAPTSSMGSSSSSDEETSSPLYSSSTTSSESSARSLLAGASTAISDSSISITIPSTASKSAAIPDAIESAQSDNNAENSSPSFGTGAIVGLAIGVSVLVVLCALMTFFLYRRHKKSRIPTLATYSQAPTEIKYSDAYPPGTHAPEIDSSPKAATDGTSELHGSEIHVRNSTVSSLTTSAQGYSPASMVSPAVSAGGGVGMAAGRMGQIEEKDEQPAVELWGGPVYRPYRPGLENQSGHGNVHAFGNAHAYDGT